MSLANNISKKIAFGNKNSFSGTIIRIAIIAVGLSVGAMIIGVSFIKGFQQGVQEKFYSSWGHIHITPFLADPNNILQEETFPVNDTLLNKITALTSVVKAHSYSLQSVIVKSKKEVEGLALKGYRSKKDFDFISKSISSGTIPNFNTTSQEILLSKTSAKKLKVKVKDKLLLYFLLPGEQNPRIRKVNVAGIFATGLEEYDKSLALCSQALLNDIRNDSISQIQGYEIYIKDATNAEVIKDKIYKDYVEAPLYVYTVKERFENIFTWLSMLSVNEKILISIMLIVAIMNMVTTLLILILERTQMIGILKSLGMRFGPLMNIFLSSAFYILVLGLCLGNLLGLGIIYAQKTLGFIKLNPDVYYIDTAPVIFPWSYILFINGLVILIMLVVLIIPSLIIKNITPIKALKFE
jgi:lipoprotein-releasing system permease protein